MKIERAASIPLVTHDPYFSIWSSTDHLYDGDTVHWCKRNQALRGYITVDGTIYCFMGDKQFHQIIPQTSLDVTAVSTEYGFENDDVALTVRFTSPLLLSDPVVLSRPCTYVDFSVVRKKAGAFVTIDFTADGDLVRFTPGDLTGGAHDAGTFRYAMMGKAKQTPLGHSGDHLTIDWGFAYLACDHEADKVRYDDKNGQLAAAVCLGQERVQASLMIAYDDLASIFYFGQWIKAYWTTRHATILDAIGAAFAEKTEVLKKCDSLNSMIEEKAMAVGGSDYAFICCMSYRHSIAAHKLIADENGELIFLSKENDSNGCIGTVDISYPSAPLYLMFNTEYVKGMLRPVFRFAACDVWEYDFAPHDVGRYPYAAGQVYGLNDSNMMVEFNPLNEMVFPFYYMFPKGSDAYAFRNQMPVEESGNMLILTAAICAMDGKADFALPYYPVLKQWTEYLLSYGADPGEQLCTDDFAGHLSHNVNLSAKAIMGIEAFAMIAKQMGEDAVYEEYHSKAAAMADNWVSSSDAGDHTMLSFGKPETWSLKYNLIWDKLFGRNLFPGAVYERELAYYQKQTNLYGVPLDSRKSYTKSDWILWCAAMAPKGEIRESLIAPVARYLRETTDRLPFSDWYETETGKYCHFIARSVQGGIYMPMLMEYINS